MTSKLDVIKRNSVTEQLLLEMSPIESAPNEYCLERSQRIVVGKWHAKFDELPAVGHRLRRRD